MTPAEALRSVCTTALYWEALPETIEAVRVLLGDEQTAAILTDVGPAPPRD